MSLLAVYRPPFELTPTVRHLPVGSSLAELRAAMPLPDDFDTHGVICLNGHPVPVNQWRYIRPKPAANGVPVEITFHAAIRGGGGGDGGGGKNVLSIVAAVALTAATGFILGGGLATGGLFTAGSISASALAAGVGLAGSLIISGLISPPTFQQASQEAPEARSRVPGNAGAEGNVLEANGPIPRVVGKHRVTPPLACEPFIYFEGEDEIAEAVYVLAGPHQLADIRIANAPIGEARDIEFETRQGWPGDRRLRLLQRHGRTESIQAELRGHTVSETDETVLSSESGDLEDALPQTLNVACKDSPDEIWIHLVFPQGIHRNGSDTTKFRVPLRLRMREIGREDWINLPDLHFQASRLTQMRATIKIRWTDDLSQEPSAPSNEGWVEARSSALSQNVSPNGSTYRADSYFATSGDSYLDSTNTGTTGVLNTRLFRHVANFQIDESVIPKGRYEVELVRGYAFRNLDYDPDAYTIDSSRRDPFSYENTSTPQIYQTKAGVVDTTYILRAVSVWNESPVQTTDCATIAVRARNRRVERLSVEASGFVKDWDGNGWNTVTTTSNPAPHFRDVLAGPLNMDPVPQDLIDDPGLATWRAVCDEAEFECNMVVQGESVAEVLRIIGACGYARPYMSERWGIVRDYDRSNEGPVQIFTPRNSANFSFTRAFPKVPDGFRVSFANRDLGYDTDQVDIFRAGKSNDSGFVEQVVYEGVVDRDAALTRALYDLRQADYRATFYNLDVPAEAIVCRKGSLVGVIHDMLDGEMAQGRIVSTTAGSSGLSAITIDDVVPTKGEPTVGEVTDFLSVANVLDLGKRTGAVIRRSDGTITVHELAAVTGESATLTFADEIDADGVDAGCLVAVGPLAREMLRLIVLAVQPREDLTATLTLIDEAPELWAGTANTTANLPGQNLLAADGSPLLDAAGANLTSSS